MIRTKERSSRALGLVACVAAGVVLLFWGVPSFGLTIAETEINDTFGEAQTVGPGVTAVEGALEERVPTPDYTYDGTLSADSTDYYTISSGSPGIDFFAWTDNSASGVDTVLGWFDDSWNLIDSDDDSSPVGDGYASALFGQADANGDIYLGVTGYPNFFGGDPHSESGDYTLYVALGVTDWWADVDFYAFTGLTPGVPYVLETHSRSGDYPDTMLGWFAADGSFLDGDDDGGWGLFSRMVLVAPSDGTLYVAVTGYPDWFFEGDHLEIGAYTLTIQPVPEPSTLVLLGSGLAAAWGARRRRKE